MEWWPLVLSTAGIATGFALRWLAKSIARQVVADIGDSLQDRWQADIEKAVEPVDARLYSIEKQLSPNGGESLFDKVARIERTVSPPRFGTDPEGTPQGF